MLATYVDSAMSLAHALRMDKKPMPPAPKQDPKAILARNLRALMDLRGWNQVRMARESGVSQRHISDILNRRTDATGAVIDKLAQPFGRKGYELQIEGLHDELLASTGNLSTLVSAYVRDPELRKFLDSAFALAPKKSR